MGDRLLPKALLAAAVAWAMMGAGASAQTTSSPTFIPTLDGFTFNLPGIDAAGAVVDALPGAAVASLVATQSLVGNVATEPNINVSVGFEQSGIGNQGIVDVNQEAGTLNNQANLRAIAVVLDGQQFQGFDLDLKQVRIANTLTVTGGIRETHITDSFAGTTGLVGINQSAGSLNQELNAVVVVIGATLGSDVSAVGDATLAAQSSSNMLISSGGGQRSDTLSNSFANFHGIAQVTQSSGDLNIIANRLAISVTSEFLK